MLVAVGKGVTTPLSFLPNWRIIMTIFSNRILLTAAACSVAALAGTANAGTLTLENLGGRKT